MSEEKDVVETTDSESTEQETTDEDQQTGAVLDADAVEQQEQTVDDLLETVDEQQARIEELEDMLLDLSTRVADGNSMGVCPDCHGAVIKVDPWFRSAKIKCTDCDRVFHEY